MAGNKRWSLKDVEYLKENYGVLHVSEISETLNRSIDAVHWKASSLGIFFNKVTDIPTVFDLLERIHVLENEVARLKENIPEKVRKSEKEEKHNTGLRKRNIWMNNYELYSVGIRCGTLNQWVKENRKKYRLNKLTSMQVDLLKKIDFDFKIPSETWNTNWEARLEKYTTGIRDHEIIEWSSRNKVSYKLGTLSEYRKNKLIDAGFNFSPVMPYRPKWDVFFEQYKAGIIDEPVKQWIYRTRRLYKDKKLSEDKITQLKSIKFKFS